MMPLLMYNISKDLVEEISIPLHMHDTNADIHSTGMSIRLGVHDALLLLPSLPNRDGNFNLTFIPHPIIGTP